MKLRLHIKDPTFLVTPSIEKSTDSEEMDTEVQEDEELNEQHELEAAPRTEEDLVGKYCTY